MGHNAPCKQRVDLVVVRCVDARVDVLAVRKRKSHGETRPRRARYDSHDAFSSFTRNQIFDSVVLLKCTGHLFDLLFSCELVHGLNLACFDKHELLQKYLVPIAQPAGNLDAILVKALRTRN